MKITKYKWKSFKTIINLQVHGIWCIAYLLKQVLVNLMQHLGKDRTKLSPVTPLTPTKSYSRESFCVQVHFVGVFSLKEVQIWCVTRLAQDMWLTNTRECHLWDSGTRIFRSKDTGFETGLRFSTSCFLPKQWTYSGRVKENTSERLASFFLSSYVLLSLILPSPSQNDSQEASLSPHPQFCSSKPSTNQITMRKEVCGPLNENRFIRAEVFCKLEPTYHEVLEMFCQRVQLKTR